MVNLLKLSPKMRLEASAALAGMKKIEALGRPEVQEAIKERITSFTAPTRELSEEEMEIAKEHAPDALTVKLF
jgi:hypothetical protein